MGKLDSTLCILAFSMLAHGCCERRVAPHAHQLLSATTSVSNPSSIDNEIESLISNIDAHPDCSHYGYSDSTGRLTQIGAQAFLPLLEAFQTCPLKQRPYIAQALRDVAGKLCGMYGPDWNDMEKNAEYHERYRKLMESMPAFEVKASNAKRKEIADRWRAWFESYKRVPVGIGEHASRPNAPLVTFDQLEEGDFVWDRSPPLIPGQKLKSLLDTAVCIEGQYGTSGDGKVLLTRPHERWLTPLRVIVCNTASPQSGELRLGTVCGVLRIRPHPDSTGRLQTVYELDDATFTEQPSQTR